MLQTAMPSLTWANNSATLGCCNSSAFTAFSNAFHGNVRRDRGRKRGNLRWAVIVANVSPPVPGRSLGRLTSVDQSVERIQATPPKDYAKRHSTRGGSPSSPA